MVFDIFSKRQKATRGEMPDIYAYDSLPEKLKIQIIHITKKCFGNGSKWDDDSSRTYKRFIDILKQERGTFFLVPNKEYYEHRGEEFFEYFYMSVM
jgi:hypothetical protein